MIKLKEHSLSQSSWLSIAEYSTKYKVSISTLRRKIKSDEIKYRLEDGKYYLLEEVSHQRAHWKEHRPSPHSDTTSMGSFAGGDRHYKQHDILWIVNDLLTEIKKAYSQILHEKEEQILLLREEITDLKTLIKVLEK